MTIPIKAKDNQRLALERLSLDELDEIVRDLKSAAAAAINNHGRETQIEYILGNSEPVIVRKPRIPRVLIDMTGGFVESIRADGPAEIVIIDHDEVDDDQIEQVRTINGEETYIWLSKVEEIVEPSVLDPYFEAAKEVRKEVLNGDN